MWFTRGIGARVADFYSKSDAKRRSAWKRARCFEKARQRACHSFDRSNAQRDPINKSHNYEAPVRFILILYIYAAQWQSLGIESIVIDPHRTQSDFCGLYFSEIFVFFSFGKDTGYFVIFFFEELYTLLS